MLYDTNSANLLRVCYMSTTIGLNIQTVNCDDSDLLQAFRKQVYAEALKNRPRMSLDRALGLTLRFRMPRPKTGHKGELWHITRPDMDNMEKACMDALTDARVWQDDSLVAFKRAEKTYSDDFVGVEIGIIELENVPEAK